MRGPANADTPWADPRRTTPISIPPGRSRLRSMADNMGSDMRQMGWVRLQTAHAHPRGIPPDCAGILPSLPKINPCADFFVVCAARCILVMEKATFPPISAPLSPSNIGPSASNASEAEPNQGSSGLASSNAVTTLPPLEVLVPDEPNEQVSKRCRLLGGSGSSDDSTAGNQSSLVRLEGALLCDCPRHTPARPFECSFSLCAVSYLHRWQTTT